MKQNQIKIEAASRLAVAIVTASDKVVKLNATDGEGNVSTLLVGPDFVKDTGKYNIAEHIHGYMFNTDFKGDKAKTVALTKALRKAYDSTNGDPNAVLKAVKEITNLRGWTLG